MEEQGPVTAPGRLPPVAWGSALLALANATEYSVAAM